MRVFRESVLHKHLRSRCGGQRAFTLTEVTVVLGIVGLVLGSIWVAAASVYYSNKSVQLTKQYSALIYGIGKLYPAGSSMPFDANFQQEMVTAGAVPPDMVAPGTTNLVDAFGTSTVLVSSGATPSTRAFSMSFSPQNVQQCMTSLKSMAMVDSEIATKVVSASIEVSDSGGYDNYVICQAAGYGDPPCSIDYSSANLVLGTPPSTVKTICDTVMASGASSWINVTYK